MMTDWMPELADDDLDVLMEALEAWERKDLAGDMALSLLEAAIRRGGSMPPEMVAQRELDKAQSIRDKRIRQERSVLLRAKLLTIRDRRRAEHMTREALNSHQGT